MNKSRIAFKRHLVSIDEAAEYLGVVPRTIRRRIADGTITGYRVGSRTVRIDLSDVDSMLRPIPAAAGGADHG